MNRFIISQVNSDYVESGRRQDFEDPETESVIVGEDPPCDEDHPENCLDVGDEGDYEEVGPLPGFPLVIPGAGGGISLVW